MIEAGRYVNKIVLHHTATSRNTSVESIRSYHMNTLGWSDIGYHYLIDRDGLVRLGRPEYRQGAHVRGHNAASIGIAVIGNYEASAFPDIGDVLGALFEDLMIRYPVADVFSHRDFANTLCPGKFLHDWLMDWRRDIQDLDGR